MAWTITAEMVETCSCNMLCPCWYGIKELMIMDQGWCASVWLFRIRQGDADGVNLDGRTLSMWDYFPGPTLLDGNGTGRLYIDYAASVEQRRALEAIFQGKKAGPPQIIGGLITTWLPTQMVKVDVREENGTLTATIGSIGQIKSQRLANEAGQPMIMQNTGLTTALQFDNRAAQLAPGTGTRWSDPVLPQHFELKSGAAATFTWRVK
jgi:hypothetical protein